jgi:magnesium transporter
MYKINLPHLSTKVLRRSAEHLFKQMRPSINKVGASPGTLTYTGESTTATTVKVFNYDPKAPQFEDCQSLEAISRHTSKKMMNWIDVTGFKDIDRLSEIGKHFEIDQLTMEDLLNVGQLPKIEQHENYLYITLKLIVLNHSEHKIEITHYSLIVKNNLLITFSENPNRLFEDIEKRLQNSRSKLFNSNINYLSYRIVDTIVDYYYLALEWLMDILSELEIQLIEKPSKEHINSILTFKKQWLVLRKAIYPMRDAVRKVANHENEFLKTTGKHYINDLSDHLQSIGETMEIIRETLENLMDLYNSTVSNRMNEVMQVLTTVATIFIPLTFIAGIYGMNFQHMPETSWPNGYYYALLLMLTVAIVMIVFMKRKRWF